MNLKIYLLRDAELSGGMAAPQPSSIRARVRALPDYPLQPSFKKIISTKNVNSINIDGQVK